VARKPVRTRLPDRPSHARIRLRRTRLLLRPMAWSLLVGILLVGGIAGLYAAQPAGRLRALIEDPSPLSRWAGLTVQEVVVEGRRNTPRDLLHAAIGAQRGDPMIGFSAEEARARLKTIAWVRDADVERRLPGTILVRLQERTPFAIWQQGREFSIVDRDGRVVEAESLDAFGPLPLIVGAGAARHAAAFHDLLRAHKDILDRTQALVRVGERRWNLRLHNGADVMLPEGQEAPALNRLAEMQARHALLDRPLLAIDLRLADRMVLRHPPAPPAPAPATRPARSGERQPDGQAERGSGRG